MQKLESEHLDKTIAHLCIVSEQWLARAASIRTDDCADAEHRYTFIHLRKAKAIQGGGVVVDIGVWRGHLNSVTGFSLGTIG